MGMAVPSPTLDRLRQTLAGIDPGLAPGLRRGTPAGAWRPRSMRCSAAGWPAARCMNWRPRRPSILRRRPDLPWRSPRWRPAQRGQVLWIATDFAAGEAGGPYGPGLDLLRLGGRASARCCGCRARSTCSGRWRRRCVPRARLRRRRTAGEAPGRSDGDAPAGACRARGRRAASACCCATAHGCAERGGDPLGDRRRSEPARSLRRPRPRRASTSLSARTGADRAAGGSSIGIIMNAPSTRRYLSVWLRRLSTDRIERRLPAPADEPRVVVASVKSAQRIVALNDAAAAARASSPAWRSPMRAPCIRRCRLRTPMPEADRRLLEAVADWCDRYTPLVGLDPPDGLMLDITGCAHLFGGEAALAAISSRGWRVRVCTRAARGRRHRRLRLARGALRRLCSSARLLRTETARLLHRPARRDRSGDAAAAGRGVADRSRHRRRLATRGLKRVADLVARPRAPLAARFGEELLRRLDQALGRCDEPITPRLPLPACHGRAALRRADRARSRRARHHRASGARTWPTCWSGAARARG